MYDAVIPDVHADFLDEPDPSYAWAWRIGADGQGFSLETIAATPNPATMPALPHGLDVLRFMLSGDATLEHRGVAAGWSWRRHT